MKNSFFKMIFGPSGQYLSLVGNEELKDSSKRLGIQSLILSIVGTILLLGFVALGSVFASNVNETMQTEGYSFPITNFFLAIVFYAFALVCLFLVLDGISFAVYQRKLNKQKIGTAALIVSLVGLGLSVIGTILMCVLMI